jgi:hypothetical protein
MLVSNATGMEHMTLVRRTAIVKNRSSEGFHAANVFRCRRLRTNWWRRSVTRTFCLLLRDSLQVLLHNYVVVCH